MRPRVYDKDMVMTGVLENADSIYYKLSLNEINTASFQLPVGDEKHLLLTTNAIVDIYDGDSSVGKFKVLNQPMSEINAGTYVTYDLEHVIAFLLGDVINGYLELGGEGMKTSEVITKLLKNQTVRRWKLGVCDFDYEFSYSWENTNLLDALFSIPQCFSDKYKWTYNTKTYPWTINLVRCDTAHRYDIRRGKNLQTVKREVSTDSLITRLYCKGYGEGADQLTIADVNNGLPYLDAETQDEYGIISGFLIDQSITDAKVLRSRGVSILQEAMEPKVTWEIKAIDLYRATENEADRLEVGSTVHLTDENINEEVSIVSIEKKDVDGDPLNVEITLSSQSSDLTTDLDKIARQNMITAQYSQGAASEYAVQFNDNCDDEHPAVLKFYVDEGAIHVNSVDVKFEVVPFRAYSRATTGGACITTSGATTTASVVPRDWDYGNTGGGSSGSTVTVMATSEAGGAANVTTLAGGAANAPVLEPQHTITILPHTHEFSLPAHTHQFNVSSHSHGIAYGIYETGGNCNVTIVVDTTPVPDSAITNGKFDAAPYLKKDSNGKIERGTWHEVSFTPSGLARIEADLHVRTFIRSITGDNL